MAAEMMDANIEHSLEPRWLGDCTFVADLIAVEDTSWAFVAEGNEDCFVEEMLYTVRTEGDWV